MMIGLPIKSRGAQKIDDRVRSSLLQCPHSTIASSESSSPSASTASFIPVKRPRQNQSLYDAVAGNSREDRFLKSPLVRTTARPRTSRAVPPETVLAYRWRRNRQPKRDDDEDEDEDEELEELMGDEDEDVKMMQAGLLVPSDSNGALPHSVRLRRRWI
jgi:hypothetical protein